MSDRGPYAFCVGVGGIGSGEFWALTGGATLGRNESRAARRLARRDFCKLHIVAHYVAALTGGGRGMAVLPIGRVGDDAAGRDVVGLMRSAGMDTRFAAADPARPTLYSVCFTYPDGDGGNLTTDDSASAAVSPDDVDAAIAALPEAPAGGRGIALAVPEAPLPARRRLLDVARARGWLTAAAVTSAEARDADAAGLLELADIVSLNRDEAAALAGADPDDDVAPLAAAAGQRLARANPSVRLAVTAGAAGAVGWADGQVEFTPAPPVRAVNTAGAGDATLAGLIVAVAAGLPFIRPDRPRRKTLADAPLATALDLAALLAGLAVAAEDTIAFDAGPDAVAALAARIGADAAGLAPALHWESAP